MRCIGRILPRKEKDSRLKELPIFRSIHTIYRKSNLSIYPESDYIRTYKKHILIFAIQDSFSRFIVHACLKEQPTTDFKNLPWWFDIADCFRETFDTYGKPFEMALNISFQVAMEVSQAGAEHPQARRGADGVIQAHAR